MTAVKATSAWPIFNENINIAGKGGTQEQVEWMAELISAPQKERAGHAKQLTESLVANQVNSHMFAMHAKYKMGNAKNRRCCIS